jgi:SAM-dependent methyltransferase
MESRDWYDTPLYYDIIYDADTRVEAAFFEGVFAKHARTGGKKPRSVIEPACGSGRLVREMARRGWNVAGFDASERMLDFAKERAPDARLWVDRMESFAAPGGARYDLAHCLINTFRYLLTEAEACAFLKRVAAVVKRGGLFVLGLHLVDYSRTTYEHERWVMDRRGVHVVCNTRTWPANRRTRIEKLRTRLHITHRGREHRQETPWDYRTYDLRELLAILKKAMPAFEIVACHDFHCDLESERAPHEAEADTILVLRKGRGDESSPLHSI